MARLRVAAAVLNDPPMGRGGRTLPRGLLPPSFCLKHIQERRHPVLFYFSLFLSSHCFSTPRSPLRKKPNSKEGRTPPFSPQT